MIKVMVRDSIQSDLFEVSFNDNLCMALSKYITSEPIYKWNGKGPQDYTIEGSRLTMQHTDLIEIMENMAI